MTCAQCSGYAVSSGSKKPPTVMFNRKLRINAGILGGISSDVPVVTMAGLVPPGSEGNAAMAACFDQISQAVDIQSSTRRLLVYDMTELRYDFGDHLGAFLWNLPALLDGVAILVAATGQTRRNLETLQKFIGSWLPVGFYDSIAAISADVRDARPSVQMLSAKRDQCAQRGQVFRPGETAVKIVFLGSRQTGQQYRTGRRFREGSDLDCGVVGGPRELALLTAKMSRQPDLVPDVAHPPIKTFVSAQEATAQGLLVIVPNVS